MKKLFVLARLVQVWLLVAITAEKVVMGLIDILNKAVNYARTISEFRIFVPQ